MTLRANLSLHVVQGYGSRDGDKKLPSHFNQRGLLIAAVLIFGLPERQSRSSPMANEGGSSTPFPGWREENDQDFQTALVGGIVVPAGIHLCAI